MCGLNASERKTSTHKEIIQSPLVFNLPHVKRLHLFCSLTVFFHWDGPIMMMYLFLRLKRPVLDLAFLIRTKWYPPTVCVCVKTQARGSNCFLAAKNSGRWTFEWSSAGAARAARYLSQLVRGGRDDPDPEANVDAVRVIVQHKRKLERNTNTLF